jgi:hypothetical protein
VLLYHSYIELFYNPDMIPGPLAILLGLAAPLLALGLAMRAFRRRAWHLYRAYSMASCISSLFTIIVISYVAFLGRSGVVDQGFARMHFGISCGGLQIFTAGTMVVAAILASALIKRRIDDSRSETPAGRPMLAVFSVFLLVLLGVALVTVHLKGGRALNALYQRPAQ